MVEAPDSEKVAGPLLVFGGPYSNLEATTAILEEARRRGIPPGNIVCTGDLAAYCADPQGVIDLLCRSGIRIVMGNCEESLAAQAAGLRLRLCRRQRMRNPLRSVVSLRRPEYRRREPPLDGVLAATALP
jgi:hypothetical protein